LISIAHGLKIEEMGKVTFKLSDKGQSLVQALVAIGIMAIASALMASLISSQQKQIKFLESKQEAVDSKNLLTRILSNGSLYCPLATTAVGDLTFPAAAVPATLSFAKVFETATAEAMSVANGIKGQTLIGIQSLNLNQIVQVSADSYTANVVVELRQVDSSLIVPKPVVVSLSFATQTMASNPTQKEIIRCSAVNTGAPPILYPKYCIWSGTPSSPTDVMCVPPACEAGDTDDSVNCMITSNLWGGASGYQAGYCQRNCRKISSSPSAFVYTHSCILPPVCSAVSGTCTPAACKTGDTAMGAASCRLDFMTSGGPSGTCAVNCIQTCVGQ